VDFRTLTRTLIANSAFSAITGVALIAAAAPLAEWSGIRLWIVVTTGVGLLPFAVVVAFIAREAKAHLVRGVIAADLAWVAAAGLVLLGFPEAMTSGGALALGVVTAVVAMFAILQLAGLRRLTA
jgi:hypothetical protein